MNRRTYCIEKEKWHKRKNERSTSPNAKNARKGKKRADSLCGHV